MDPKALTEAVMTQAGQQVQAAFNSAYETITEAVVETGPELLSSASALAVAGIAPYAGPMIKIGDVMLGVYVDRCKRSEEYFRGRYDDDLRDLDTDPEFVKLFSQFRDDAKYDFDQIKKGYLHHKLTQHLSTQAIPQTAEQALKMAYYTVMGGMAVLLVTTAGPVVGGVVGAAAVLSAPAVFAGVSGLRGAKKIKNAVDGFAEKVIDFCTRKLKGNEADAQHLAGRAHDMDAWRKSIMENKNFAKMMAAFGAKIGTSIYGLTNLSMDIQQTADQIKEAGKTTGWLSIGENLKEFFRGVAEWSNDLLSFADDREMLEKVRRSSNMSNFRNLIPDTDLTKLSPMGTGSIAEVVLEMARKEDKHSRLTRCLQFLTGSYTPDDPISLVGKMVVTNDNVGAVTPSVDPIQVLGTISSVHRMNLARLISGLDLAYSDIRSNKALSTFLVINTESSKVDNQNGPASISFGVDGQIEWRHYVSGAPVGPIQNLVNDTPQPPSSGPDESLSAGTDRPNRGPRRVA